MNTKHSKSPSLQKYETILNTSLTRRETISRTLAVNNSILRPRQHSIGYMGDGFYRSKDQPTVSNYWRYI